MIRLSTRFQSFEEYLADDDGTDKLYELFNGESNQVPPESEIQHLVGETINIDFESYFNCGEYIRLKEDYLERDLFYEFLELARSIALKLHVTIDESGQYPKYPVGLLERVYQDLVESTDESFLVS